MKSLIPISLFLISSALFAADCGSSNADKKCQQNYINDTKPVIGGKYSNADNTSKAAKDDCCYQKMTDPKKYNQQYSSSSKSKK